MGRQVHHRLRPAPEASGPLRDPDVGGFRKVYGGQLRRGVCRNTFCKSSGKIARYILQQLEEMGLVEQDENGGRKITKEGQRELDTVAVQAGETEEDGDEEE